MNYLREIVAAQKRGEARGIVSICSAHPIVLETAFENGNETGMPVLVEATCNQVNQFGGYTGMKPLNFVSYIQNIVLKTGFSQDQLILGGDHIGPTPWQNESVVVAMNRSKQMVWDYVQAGFTKIHLDASVKLRDDPSGPLSIEVAANRAADLACVAEDATTNAGRPQKPYYVIGTEVPIAGGLQEEEQELAVTAVEDLAETLEKSRTAFLDKGLASAWERVIAVVVQPGVEYGNASIHPYDANATVNLIQFLKNYPLIYEAHSTDFQTKQALSEMVRDQFAILKVGPALTYAYREAIFALAMIETELCAGEDRSNLKKVIEQTMLSDPVHWQNYYKGDESYQQFARHYSFSDRIRYYWPAPEVQAAVKQLLRNLGSETLPLTLISQYLPSQYTKIRSKDLQNSLQAIIADKILAVLEDYRTAVVQVYK